MIAAGFAASPFISEREEWISVSPSKRMETLKHRKELYYQAIRDVDFEYAEGKLTEKDHREPRDYYKEKAIQVMRELESFERTDKKGPSTERERGR